MIVGGGSGTSTASQIVYIVFTLITVAIFIRAILSWFNLDPRSPIVQTLNAITDPVLEPIRRIMPRLGGIDLSPLVAILLLQFFSGAIQGFLG